MIVIDTNILVRLATQEPQNQWLAIVDRIRSDTAYILKTVLLETEWVLRATYQRTASEIGSFFTYLLESDGFLFEDETTIHKAMIFFSLGSDFADALHLASAGDQTFLTMDKRFCRKAIRHEQITSVELLIT